MLVTLINHWAVISPSLSRSELSEDEQDGGVERDNGDEIGRARRVSTCVDGRCERGWAMQMGRKRGVERG